MKIGLVLPSVPAYSETFFSSKIKGLEAHGFQVIVLVNKSPKNLSKNYTVKAAPKLTGNPIRVTLKSLFLLIHAILFQFSNTKRLYKLDKKDGLALSQRIKNIISNHHILSQKLDWLHFGFGTMVFHRENIAKAIGAKMSVSFRGFDIGVYPIKNPKCYAHLWEKVDKIHVISNDLQELVYREGCDKSKEIIKITPAIDVSFFKQQEKDSISFNNNMITLARLHWKKGLLYTLEALAILKEQGIPFQYTIVGEGKELEQLQFAVHQLNLSEQVHFTGKLSHKEIKELLNKSSIYLQYSIQEGFCNAVLEAQASGLLCVVSNAEGLSENILHKKTGWVVPKCNTSLLANTIKEVVFLPEEDKLQITNSAKERVSNQFTIKQQQEQFVAFYQNLN